MIKRHPRPLNKKTEEFSMRRTTNDKWKENGHVLACPHCRAGADGVTLGLYWGFDDHCWQCIICGYREYEQTSRQMSEAERVANRIWDECFDASDIPLPSSMSCGFHLRSVNIEIAEDY